MKTPLQELIDKLKDERNKLQALNERVMVHTLDYAITNAESMLEKEKEVMEEAKKNLKDEVLRIITEHDFELGKASLRKKIMNL